MSALSILFIFFLHQLAQSRSCIKTRRAGLPLSEGVCVCVIGNFVEPEIPHRRVLRARSNAIRVHIYTERVTSAAWNGSSTASSVRPSVRPLSGGHSTSPPPQPMPPSRVVNATRPLCEPRRTRFLIFIARKILGLIRRSEQTEEAAARCSRIQIDRYYFKRSAPRTARVTWLSRIRAPPASAAAAVAAPACCPCFWCGTLLSSCHCCYPYLLPTLLYCCRCRCYCCCCCCWYFMVITAVATTATTAGQEQHHGQKKEGSRGQHGAAGAATATVTEAATK